MTVSKQTVGIAGLPVHVYSNRVLGEITGKVAVLFFLHGRTRSASKIGRFVEEILRHLSEKVGTTEVELLVVTFDQRNHGERLLSTAANNAWDEGNNQHAIDMYAIHTGSARDISFLIDFLPAYLFPSAEARVVQWLAGGISLGGHSTWYALRHEPRISLGIPIIGCPDYLRLMTLRAKASNVAFEPPYIPASFLAYVQKEDPVAAPYTLSDASNPFLGKKILVLSGGDDPVVQWECSEAFVKDLEVGSQGAKKVIVYPGVGHECTPAMLKETADFVWDHVLTNSTIQ